MHCEVRASLILGLGPQVKRIATTIHRRVPATVIKDDLTQEGWLGAAAAVDNFDPDKGVALQTYAEQKIRGAILDYLRRMDHLSRRARRQLKAESERRRSVEDTALIEPTLASLDEMVENGFDIRTGETSPDNFLDATSIFDRANLSKQESGVMNALYWQGLRQVEAASSFGIHPSRLSQLRTSALMKMRAVAPSPP